MSLGAVPSQSDTGPGFGSRGTMRAAVECAVCFEDRSSA